MQLSEQNKEFLLSELTDVPVSYGVFYASEISLAGSGEGYGSVGTKIVYPEVIFEFKVITTDRVENGVGEKVSESGIKKSENEPARVPVSGSLGVEEESNEQKKNEQQIVPEQEQSDTKYEANKDQSDVQIISGQDDNKQAIKNEQDASEQKRNEKETEKKRRQDTSGQESNDRGGDTEQKEESNIERESITGSVVSENSQTIRGTVKKGTNYEYYLEKEQSGELVSGKVSSGGEILSDNAVSFEVTGSKVKVSTAYLREEKGFGKGYSGKGMSIEIPIERFGVRAEQGNLRVSLVYENVSIVTVEKEIEIHDTDFENETRNAKNETDETGIIEQNKSVLNDTMINTTVLNQTLLNQTNSTFLNNKTANMTLGNGTSVNATVKTTRAKIRIGERVRWVKNISLEKALNGTNVTIELPKEAENVSVMKIDENSREEANANVEIRGVTGNLIREGSYTSKSGGFVGFFQMIMSILTGRAISETNASVVTNENVVTNTSTATNTASANESVVVVLSDNATEYIIEYYTDAPTATEKNISSGKQVIISGPDVLNYTEVESFTTIPELVNVGEENLISIYWQENQSFISFIAQDTDNTGKIDYLEWITPHLSNQTFNITLDAGTINLSAAQNITIHGNYTHLTVSDAAPYDSLIGYWAFDGDETNVTAYDWGRYNNNGTYGNNTALNTSCMYGSCVTLNGQAERGIFIGNISQTDNVESFTVMAWVHLYNNLSAYTVVSKYQSGQGTWYFAYTRASRTFTCRIFNQSSAAPTAAGVTFPAASHPGNNNLWYHAACTYNGTAIQVYINGSASGSTQSLNNRTKDRNDPVCIGSESDGTNCNKHSSEFFNGSIDEVMFFNTSLTAAQISDIYNNQSMRFKSRGIVAVNQTNFSSGKSSVNITIRDYVRTQGSNISLRIGESDGSSTFAYSAYQNLSGNASDSGSSNNYSVLGTTTNITLDFLLSPGNGSGTSPGEGFYTPLLKISSSNVTILALQSPLYLESCGELSSANTTYTLSSDVSASATCFNITANNITLNGAGLLINYSQSAAGYGVYARGFNGTIIKNVRITPGTTTYLSAVFLSYAHNGSVQNSTIGALAGGEDSAVNTINSSNTTVTGNNISCTGNGTACVSLHGGNTHTVSHNTFNVSNASTHGIHAHHSTTGSLLVNNTIYAGAGSGIYLESGNSTVINNTIIGTGNIHGIWITDTYMPVGNVTLSGNKVNTSGSQSYFIEGTTSSAFNNSIDTSNLAEGLSVLFNYSINNLIVLQNSNNQYGQVICAWCVNVTYNNVTMSGDGISLLNNTASMINNATINTSVGWGVYVYRGKHNLITNVTIKTVGSSYLYGIYANIANASNMTNNDVETTGSNSYAVYYLASSDGLANNNRVNTTGAASHGVFLNTSANWNIVRNNSVTTSGASHALFLGSVAGSNTITNNNLTTLLTSSSNAHGISIQSSNNTFDNNTVTTNAGYSIYMQSVANNTFLRTTSIKTYSTPNAIVYVTGGVLEARFIDSILNHSSGNEMYFDSNTTGGILNFTNVTRINSELFNISWAAGGNGTVNMHRYLDVNTTVNQTQQPLADANVSAFNVNNALLYNVLSDSSGMVSRQAVLAYIRNGTGGTNYTYFSTFTVNATKAGYLNASNNTVIVNNSNVLVALGLIDVHPTIDFTAPTPVNRTNITTFSVNVTATDTNLQAIVIRLYNSTLGNVNTTTYASSPAFVNYSNFANGIYYFNATSNDTAGNANNSETRTVTYDTSGPAITINYPDNGITHYSASINFNATVIDNLLTIDSCLYSLDSASNVSMTKYNESYFNVTYSGIAHGYHNLTVSCNDTLNNMNATTESNFNVVLVDVSIPNLIMPNPVYPNSTFITVNVSNNGPPNATNVNVTCAMDGVIFESKILGSVTGQSSALTNCTRTLTSGNFSFNVTADYGNSIPESDETNNANITIINAVIDFENVSSLGINTQLVTVNYNESVNFTLTIPLGTINTTRAGYNISSVWVNVTLPNATVNKVYLSGSATGGVWNRTWLHPSLLGNYSLTYFANLTNGFDIVESTIGNFAVKNTSISIIVQSGLNDVNTTDIVLVSGLLRLYNGSGFENLTNNLFRIILNGSVVSTATRAYTNFTNGTYVHTNATNLTNGVTLNLSYVGNMSNYTDDYATSKYVSDAYAYTSIGYHSGSQIIFELDSMTSAVGNVTYRYVSATQFYNASVRVSTAGSGQGSVANTSVLYSTDNVTWVVLNSTTSRGTNMSGSVPVQGKSSFYVMLRSNTNGLAGDNPVTSFETNYTQYEYSTNGTYVSDSIFLPNVTLTVLNWDQNLSSFGTSLIELRESNDSVSWSAFGSAMTSNLDNAISSFTKPYLQFRATLNTTNQSVSPRIYSVNISYFNASSNASGGYAYNITIPTNSLGVQPLQVSVLQSPQGIIGHNSTNITVRARTAVSYAVTRNYTTYNANYSLIVNFTRADTNALVYGTFNLSLMNASGSIVYGTNCSGTVNCSISRLVPADLPYGNYTVLLNASNTSAYYINASANFGDYLEQRNTTGSLQVINRTIQDFSVGTNYGFYWNASITNNGNASMNNISVFDDAAARSSGISSVRQTGTCSRLYPQQTCNVTVLINVSGAAQIGANNPHFISWRANWSDNDGAVSGGISNGFITFTDMYVIIESNATMTITNNSINTTIEHGNSRLLQFNVSSVGSSAISNVNISVNASHNNASWVNVTPSFIASVEAGTSRIINVTITIPNQTTTGNYSFMLNVNTSNANSALLNISVDVPLNATWSISPGGETSYNATFGLNAAGEVGNFTLRNTGNLNLTFNLTYSAFGTLYTSFGTNLFSVNYLVGSTLTNPTNITLAKGTSQTITIYQKGRSSVLSNVGINLNISNETGVPASNVTTVVFNIIEANPQVNNITFVYDGSSGVVAELNKSVTVKVIASDDVGLNLTAGILNISWGNNKTNLTLSATETYQNGIYYPGVNYTVDFTPNATGNHSAQALVKDAAGNANLSVLFNFTVYGATSATITANVSAINLSNVDRNNKQSFYINYTLNNTGLVYCYAPTVTFSGPGSISVGPSSYTSGDLRSGGSSSNVSQINVSAGTMAGTHSVTASLSCRNPDATYATSSAIVNAIVISNLSFSTAPSDSLSYTVSHGSSASGIIRINNTGNDNLTSVQASCLSGTLCSAINVAFNQSIVNVTFNATASINVSFSVASGTLPAGYTGTIRVTNDTRISDLSASVTVPSSLTWNATPSTIALLKATSTSGSFGSVTLNNTGNVNLTLRINSTNTTLFVVNVSSLFLPVLSVGSFLINYSAPSTTSNVNASITITNESATPSSLNISLLLNATSFNFTIVSPTNNSPLSNVLAGDTVRFIITALYAGENVTSGVNWSATIGSSSSCANINATYSSAKAHWNISCTAPSITDGTTYTLFVTGVHDIAGATTYNSTNSIVYRDITPPSFNIIRNNFNIGGVINLTVNVTDSTEVGSVKATVTYPNSTIINLSLSQYNGLYNVTGQVTSLAGEYIVNYSANDTVGNSNSTIEWFEVYDIYSWAPKILDYASSPVTDANITLYRPEMQTTLLGNLTNASGTTRLSVNKRFYDVHIEMSGDKAIIRNVNFTNASTFNLNLHRIASGVLAENLALHKAFSGITSNSTNLSSNVITLVFNYSGYTYDSASKLEIIKCSSWNYTARTCSSSWADIATSIDRNTTTVRGNSTGFSAYFLSENKCGNGLCESTYSETTATCASDCPAATTVVTSGGGGGGGGGSSGLSSTDLSKIEEIIKSFINIGGVKIETTSIYKEMFAGESTTFRIKLKNTLNSEATIYLEGDGDVKKFLTFESNNIKLNSNEERDLLVRITVPKEIAPNNYDGDLVLSVGEENKGKIPVTIRILAPEGKLLDVKIQALTQTIAPGKVLRLQTDLVNLGQTNKVDVQFDLQLLDVNTGTIIARTEEAFAVETTISTIKNISVPITTKPGKYMVKGTAYYSNVENGQMQASSLTYVTVEIPFFIRKLFGISYWIYCLIILLIASGSGTIYLVRYLEFRKKRFKTKVEFNKLPQAGENSVFVGKIAETGIRAFIDMNKLQMHTLIAGATGGGKTIAAQALAEAALLKNKSVIVFDPTAQWTGFLRKCEDGPMLKRYAYFDMKAKEARAFNGSITTVHDPYEIIDIKKYIARSGEITIFNVSHLTPAQIDILVASTIEQIFESEPEESVTLKSLIIYDEVHRLLPKFGGTGKGFIQLERGAREFRKWGVGLVLISQVLSDFIGEIKANIGTEIQMGTRYEGDLERINAKYGEDMLKSVVKEPIGTGMLVNAEYNSGRPYFVSFRPILHSIKRLSNEELARYEKYFAEVEDIEYQVSRFKEYGIDTLDFDLEIKLTKDKIKVGQFQMADMYLDSLRPEVAERWKSLKKNPEHLMKSRLNKEDVEKAVNLAKTERTKFIKKNPEKELSFREILEELKRGIETGKKKGKDVSKLELRLSDFERRLKSFTGALSMKDKQDIEKELDSFRKEVASL